MTKYIFILLAVFFSCTNKHKVSDKAFSNNPTSSSVFKDDVKFLEQYGEIHILSEPSGQGKIAVSGPLQARVMTSTSRGDNGRSYGWINRDLFKSGETLPHINAYGGEERFWLGPEGGQFSIFFAPGAQFTLEEWQTPSLIDLDPFDLESSKSNQVVFTKKASLTNYSGTEFNFLIRRKIEVLSTNDLFNSLKIKAISGLNAVAYQSSNSLTNTGTEAWTKESGMLSIWLLGMFNPSPSTTIVVPYQQGDDDELGPIVNDDYFGKVPADRLIIKDNAIFFSGDGKYRSKIGLLPSRAKGVIGAFDVHSKTLTICTYNQPTGVFDYVNSQWKIQEEPFRGDAINSYNDGTPSSGGKPLGPFYELETSSPALALKPGESGNYLQTTYHFEGDIAELDRITLKVLGVSIQEITTALP